LLHQGLATNGSARPSIRYAGRLLSGLLRSIITLHSALAQVFHAKEKSALVTRRHGPG